MVHFKPETTTLTTKNSENLINLEIQLRITLANKH